MNAQGAAVLACVGSLTAAASAQIITTQGITARLDLTWQEDPAFVHNDNGFLEPGERALMLMTASFTGQNTVASFFPPVGPYSSGTVVAFGSAYIDIRSASLDPSGLYNGGLTSPTSSSVGPNANSLGTSGYGVRGGWRLGGNVANGAPVSNGFANVGPGQLYDNIGNFTNPITNIERLGWAPNSYAARTVTFSIVPAATAGAYLVRLELDVESGGLHNGAYLPISAINLGTVDIPIAPAPGGLAVLAMGGCFSGRRRRVALPTEVSR